MPSRDKYTDPELRDEVKEEIQEGDKGGAPGQWSARKAQRMASEYKKRGGGYTTDKKDQDESQKNLSKWGEEEWQTKDGSGNAKQEDGTQKRYLPKKAWEDMTEEERKEADEKKQVESKEGKQFAGNTDRAKEEKQKANDEETKKYEEKKTDEKKQNVGQKKSQNGKKNDDKIADDKEIDGAEDGEKVTKNGSKDKTTSSHSEADSNGAGKQDEDEYIEDDNKEEVEEDEEEDENDVNGEDGSNAKQSVGKKRTRAKDDQSSSNKKQKDNSGESKKDGTVGSRHDKAEAPAAQGSNDRLPKKGQSVHWKAMPGWIDGEVVEIVKEHKKVEGKDIKASEDEPRLVLKSNSSGKICVHKPDNIHFD